MSGLGFRFLTLLQVGAILPVQVVDIHRLVLLQVPMAPLMAPRPHLAHQAMAHRQASTGQRPRDTGSPRQVSTALTHQLLMGRQLVIQVRHLRAIPAVLLQVHPMALSHQRPMAHHRAHMARRPLRVGMARRPQVHTAAHHLRVAMEVHRLRVAMEVHRHRAHMERSLRHRTAPRHRVHTGTAVATARLASPRLGALSLPVAQVDGTWHRTRERTPS